MKYLVVGDVHWSQYSSILRSRGQKYSTRLENLVESVNFVEDLAKKNNCYSIIYLGDFFDRPDLNAEELTALQDIQWAKDIHHVFIVGNHESNVNTLQFSSTKVFESINATVISESTTWDMGHAVFTFIPYATNLKPFSEYVSNGNHIVFAHTDIAGIQYGNFITTQGFDINEINANCLLMFDGHLHNGGMIGKKIILPGNLTGQNFTEDANLYEHSVYILDINSDGIIVERHTNEAGLKFYKIRIENEADLNRIDSVRNNAVVSISCNNIYKQEVIDKAKNNPNILEYRISVYYETYDTNNSEELFEAKDPFEQFIVFARTKLAASPILNDELSRLKG